MKKQIPNIITLLNLLSGCIAIVLAVQNQLALAAIFVAIGIVFDFLDGLAARLLKVQSAIGLQLDSLADLVTCGVVPGIVMFQLLRMADTNGWESAAGTSSDFLETMIAHPLPLLGFLITLASAYRLAKFNIDENQVSSFVGLPTPANALLILSFPLILWYHNNDSLNEILLNPLFLAGATLFSAFILNANLPLFALKFKSFNIKENGFRYLFIITSFILALTMEFIAIPIIIGVYIAMSIVMNLKAKQV